MVEKKPQKHPPKNQKTWSGILTQKGRISNLELVPLSDSYSGNRGSYYYPWSCDDYMNCELFSVS
jgi:hypothetical protein